MSTSVDLELKKAFGELHVKVLNTSKKIQMIDTQLEVFEQVMRHVEITQGEIGAMPPDTRIYDSVGRMFLLTDMEVVKTNLVNKLNHFSSRITELEENKNYLEKNLKESQDNIREMVEQWKQQTK
ncbi:prefoldin subunit 1 [Leptidea sinapis]|uniref:Prefoldin subunit 1 n=1 Tax=Leptidea sinapis TaxID=189913 RepID=A0A5E4QHE6_9NEOP|nr:prefoldin subunit 1 [Leptidea sinapis]VVC96962.1 unnamed protein product [Leptidea sinapis]